MTPPAPRLVRSGPLPYLCSVPAGPAAGPRPLLCFLHGRDEAAPVPVEEGVTRHGPLRPGGSARFAEEFIVVAPQLPVAGDLWHRHAEAVREIVEEVRAAHGGDPLRSYLTGFSFGGNGVFDLALARPDAWAALWVVDPTRVPRRDPGRPVWLSVGGVARRAREAFARALELRPAGPAPGGDRVYLDEGEDHVGSATRAYRDERIVDWLLARSLPRGA